MQRFDDVGSSGSWIGSVSGVSWGRQAHSWKLLMVEEETDEEIFGHCTSDWVDFQHGERVRITGPIYHLSFKRKARYIRPATCVREPA